MKKLMYYSCLLTVLTGFAGDAFAQTKTALTENLAAQTVLKYALENDLDARACFVRSSIIKFSSGVVFVPFEEFGFNPGDYVMGDGTGDFLNISNVASPAQNTMLQGSFAFSAPADGCFIALCAATDIDFPNDVERLDTTITFTFNLNKSTQCSTTPGTPTSYSAPTPTLCSVVTFMPPVPSNTTITACGVPCAGSATSLKVKKGDRFVLQVSGPYDTPVLPAGTQLAFQTALTFVPASISCP